MERQAVNSMMDVSAGAAGIRRRHRMARCTTFFVALMLAGWHGGAAAQDDYPNKPIRYISPYSPGGSTTFVARLIGQQLTDAWGQQVVVDNRPGAKPLSAPSSPSVRRPTVTRCCRSVPPLRGITPW
jgi:hypothetical protein